MAAKKTGEKNSEKVSEKQESAPGIPIQPEINIGLVGHVDHGKTTITEKLSGKWTDQHSEEIKRGITIRLGYADVTIYKCPNCPEPDCYSSKPTCPRCGTKGIAQRKISLVDAPGHESLMATMLSGATIMDGALLLISANEQCPQPQTREHLVALEIIGIKNIVIVQNKIDLVSPEMAKKNYDQIKALIKGTAFENAPIIPTSAIHNVNIDALIGAIQEFIPTPKRDTTSSPVMFVARSFDINRPGADPEKLTGGVLGGSLKQGTLKDGEQIEIKPGRRIEKEGRVRYEPILTTIVGLKTGGANVKEVHHGGSIGVMTNLDPSIVSSDKLAGTVVGHVGKLPPIWTDLTMETHTLERVVGLKDDLIVNPIRKGEALMLNVNSAATVGVVTETSKKGTHCVLKLPVCADKGNRVTISRKLGNRWRLIGYGVIK